MLRKIGWLWWGLSLFCTKLLKTNTAKLLFLMQITYFINIRFHIQMLSLITSGYGQLEVTIKPRYPARAEQYPSLGRCLRAGVLRNLTHYNRRGTGRRTTG